MTSEAIRKELYSQIRDLACEVNIDCGEDDDCGTCPFNMVVNRNFFEQREVVCILEHIQT